MPPDPLADHPVSEMSHRGYALVKRLLEYESHRDVIRELKGMSHADLEAIAVMYISDVMRTAPAPSEPLAAERLLRWLQVGESRD